MERSEILKHVDHTLLAQDATWERVKKLCDEALAYKAASVCIAPAFVGRAAAYLGGRCPVCTVIGFPNGYSTTRTKVFETEEAIADGADEIDMVINIGALKENAYSFLADEISKVRKASAGKILKVIIETCLLTDEEKIRMCALVSESGADFIKTSTGFAGGGATARDIRLLAAHINGGLKIKAAGGIASFDDAQAFIGLGAERLGTSRLIKLALLEDSGRW